MSPKRDTREEEPHLDCSLWDTDIKEEGEQEALNFVLSEHQKTRDHENHGRTAGGGRYAHTHKQVVTGMNPFLDVEISRTKCTRSEPNEDSCLFHEQLDLPREKLWSFHIYAVPRLSKTSVEKPSGQAA